VVQNFNQVEFCLFHMNLAPHFDFWHQIFEFWRLYSDFWRQNLQIMSFQGGMVGAGGGWGPPGGFGIGVGKKYSAHPLKFFEGYAEYFFPTPMPKPPGGLQTPTHPPPSALNCWLWSVVLAESIRFFGVLEELKYMLPPTRFKPLWAIQFVTKFTSETFNCRVEKFFRRCCSCYDVRPRLHCSSLPLRPMCALSIPCTNRPFKCKMQGCNMYVWTYSMKTHYADNRQGAEMSEDVKNQVLLKPHERTYVNRLVVAYTKGIKTVCPTLMKAIKNKEATYTYVLECV